MLNEKVNADVMVCDECGEQFDASKAIEIGGDILCPDCAEDFVTCFDCGKRIRRDDALEGADGELYCDECFHDTFFFCERCGNAEWLGDDEQVNVGGDRELWCQDCANSSAFKCYDCGEYFADDEHYYSDDDIILCENCYNDDWYHCENCGSLVRSCNVVWRHDTPYCNDCCSEDIIHNYHSDIRPLRWHTLKADTDRKNELFVGVELEIDSDYEDYSPDDFAHDAQAIVGAANYDIDEDVVVEHDGSLDYGFELISSTASVDYHINSYGWEDMMREALDRDYVSHGKGTCGLHVHMDRRYFSDAMENVEWNAIILVTNNADWMKKFSRRVDFGYCAFPEGVEPFKPEDFKPAYARTSTRNAYEELQDIRNEWINHYHALNFAGGATIEMRFNRGTLNFNTFTATLQFVQMFADAMKHSRLDTCARISLKWFKRVAKRRGYTQFLDYLKKHGIEENN